MIRFVFIYLTILFIFGIILAKYIFIPLEIIFALFLLMFALSVIFLRFQRINSFDLSLSILFIILGIISYRVEEFKSPSHISNFINDSQEVYVEGYVVSLVQLKRRSSKFLLRPQIIFLKTKEYRNLNGTVLVYLPSKGINYGDYLRIKGRFRRGRQGRVYLKASMRDSFEKLKHSRLNILKYYSFKMNEKIRRLFFAKFPSYQASFLSAFILGRREFLLPKDYLPFKKTGTMHLLAISGLHTGIFLAILEFILKFFSIKRRLRFSLLLLIIPFWIFFTGIKPPVVRAGLLSVFWIMTFFFQRKSHLLNNLFLSGFLILLLKPGQIFNVSFQLSYLCVLFIAIFYPYISRIRVKWRFIKDSFFISLTVWLGTFPVVSYYFGYISFLSILANLILIPLLFILIILLFLYLICFKSILGEGLYFSISFLLLLFMEINRFLASLEFSYLRINLPPGFVLSYYIFLGLSLIFYKLLRIYRKREIPLL